MPKRKHVDDQPMSDAEYQQFQQLQHFDAASLRALALWLNTKKKNAALMKAVTAEMGRNARHMARAVDYFGGFFLETASPRTASEYLMLFEYAKLKHEDAIELFAEHRFDKPLYQLREVVSDSRRTSNGVKRATLAEQCAELVDEWRKESRIKPDNDHQFGIVETMKDCSGDLAALPAVASVLARRGKAEK